MGRIFTIPTLSELKADPKRMSIIDQKRIAFVLFFGVMFLLTEAGRYIYRPYIYANHIFDFWIADTMGNFTGTITVIFFELALINPRQRQGRYYIVLITCGLIVYELLQYLLPGSNTCDWRDIVATLLAGFVSLGMYKFLFIKFPETAC